MKTLEKIAMVAIPTVAGIAAYASTAGADSVIQLPDAQQALQYSIEYGQALQDSLSQVIAEKDSLTSEFADFKEDAIPRSEMLRKYWVGVVYGMAAGYLTRKLYK